MDSSLSNFLKQPFILWRSNIFLSHLKRLFSRLWECLYPVSEMFTFQTTQYNIKYVNGLTVGHRCIDISGLNRWFFFKRQNKIRDINNNVFYVSDKTHLKHTRQNLPQESAISWIYCKYKMRNRLNPTSELCEQSERSDRMATSFLHFFLSLYPTNNIKYQTSTPWCYFINSLCLFLYNYYSVILNQFLHILILNSSHWKFLCDVTLRAENISCMKL